MNTETGETFNIESIVCGDGEKASNGMALRRKTWYARARIDGGVESYYEIDSRTLTFSTRGGRKGGNLRTRPITEEARKKTQSPVPRVSIPSKKRSNHTYVRRRLKNAALTCLAENISCAISVGGPGQ